jgi:hypothetical protein
LIRLDGDTIAAIAAKQNGANKMETSDLLIEIHSWLISY